MIELTVEGMRAIYPRAPQDIIEAFVAKQAVLDAAGITTTRTRLAYFFSNIEHECSGFTIPELTENTRYTAKRAAQVWPNRFSSAQDCYLKIGSYEGDPLFARKLLDNVYGGRMGNAPPPSHDGSTYIGRGGPQWTGKDGYRECEKRTGLPAVADPKQLSRHDMQPEVCTAFWDWKKLNALADAGDFRGVVKRWNGGYIGIADREAQLAGNDPVIARMRNVDRILPQAKTLPGSPPTPAPPPEVVEAATAEAKARRKKLAQAGSATAGAGGANEVGKATTAQPDKAPLLPGPVAWAAVGIGIALIIVGVVLVARKRRAVAANWF